MEKRAKRDAESGEEKMIRRQMRFGRDNHAEKEV